MDGLAHFVSRWPASFELLGAQVTLEDGRPLLWAALILPVLFGLSWRSLAPLSRLPRVFSVTLRSLFLVCLLGALAGAGFERSVEKVCATLLLDVSDSMSEPALEQGLDFLAQLERAETRPDQVRVVAFAERAEEVHRVQDEKQPRLNVSELRARVGKEETNLAEGVELARATLSSSCEGRVAIVSDGRETRGQARPSLELLRANGNSTAGVEVGTYIVEPPPETRLDVAVVGVELPAQVRVGEPFRFQVRLAALGQGGRGLLRVTQSDRPSPPEFTRPLQLDGEEVSVSFESVAQQEGELSLDVVFEPEGADAFPTNNRVTRVFEAAGPPRILLVDAEPRNVSDLRQALSTQKFEVIASTPGGIPTNASELSRYASIILSDLKWEEIRGVKEQLIIDYVRKGGALLFAGGKRSYAAGGFQNSPLEKILPLKTFGEDERRGAGVALVLVIDRSGSMTGEPLEMAKTACLATLAVLDDSDYLEVIAFDAKPLRAVRMQRAGREAKITSEVARIQPGGGTEIFPSLDMAYKDLLSTSARKKHVVLLTDGNADPEGLVEIANAAFADGITLTTVGFGASLNETLLRSLADLGGGRYHAVREPSMLPRVFTRETELAALEEEFEEPSSVVQLRNAPWLSGVPVPALPPLRGLAKLRLGEPPAQAILGVDSGYPLLAVSRQGLGYAIAWASDFKSNYARDFLRASAFPRFISQLLRAHHRKDDTSVWPLSLELERGELVASFDALDDASNFDNFVESKLFVRQALAGASEESTEFSLIAPGRYQARVPLSGLGVFLIRAEHSRRGTLVARSVGSVARTYPDEYASLLRPGLGAEALGGTKIAPTPAAARALLEPSRRLLESFPLGSWLLAAGGFLLLLEISIRRLAALRGGRG